MEVLGEVAATDWDLSDGVWDGIALVDRHSVRDALARIDDGASCAPSCKQAEHCCISEVELLHLEFVEHELDKLLPDLLWIVGWLCEHELVLLGINRHFLVKQVADDLFDIFLDCFF